MSHRIEIRNSARRDLDALPKSDAARIAERINLLADNPRPPGCVKLHGTAKLWRTRVGDYRVIYQIQDDVLIVLVLSIGHRREVYRRL